jgi:hypothetical protein
MSRLKDFQGVDLGQRVHRFEGIDQMPLESKSSLDGFDKYDFGGIARRSLCGEKDVGVVCRDEVSDRLHSEKDLNCVG